VNLRIRKIVKQTHWVPASRGFTFIELLYVAGIIGILFAIAIPAYDDYIKRARVSEAIQELGAARVDVNDFFARWGYLPADNAQAGLLPPDKIQGVYSRRLEVQNGALRAQIDFGRDAGNNPILRTLTLRPLTNAAQPSAPIIWFCGKGDPKKEFPHLTVNGEPASDPPEERWLPATCRMPR
jgi:type IV pilus assembly protein PilA